MAPCTDALLARADAGRLPLGDGSVDLVLCSPPYEAQRAYAELEFNLTGQAWVEWAVVCFSECLRVSKGLVAWVVEGRTDDFAYSQTPQRLGVALQDLGFIVRKPPIYARQGIPGTGGPDWLRNDYEPIICASKGRRLPWADATALGSKPKYKSPRWATNRGKDGERKSVRYVDPDISNPGNIISGTVGNGHLGWEDAHENEAPYPEWLADFFIRSFCPPGGIVLDCFSGSGTTVAAALKAGRKGIGFDKRQSQCWLAETRVMGLTVKERRAGQRMLV